MELGPLQVEAVANLFKANNGDSDSDEDKPSSGYAKMGPGDIATPKTEPSNTGENAELKKNTKDIWDKDEVPEGSEFDSVYDPRPPPEYDIVYKQAVTSEDMFLQMGNKTPASASCEDMVVKIKLPEAKMADVQLDVKSKFLDCRTSKFKLGLHLPHPVDQRSGKAQWDSGKETLSVTLRITREYDFLNF